MSTHLHEETDSPYLIQQRVVDERAYNPEYGDDRVCDCGHTYYRHFDPFEEMNDTGCKYCGCDTFVEKIEMSEEALEKVTIVTDCDDGEPSRYEARVTRDDMNDTQIELQYLENDQSWTPEVRGTTAMKLTDHGNGITIISRDDPFNPIELTYSELEELRALLTFNNHRHPRPSTIKILQELDIDE